LEDELTMVMLSAYQHKWEFMPPPMVLLLNIAAYFGYKVKTPPTPQLIPSSSKAQPADRAAELQSIFKMFPSGQIR